MEIRSIKYVADACSGELLKGSPDTLVHALRTDSRRVQRGDLFLALKGDRFDGHNFINEVAARQVAGVLVERFRLPLNLPDCAVIAVDNTRQALSQIGSRYRRDFSVPLIAVGGSNGKTTTKELIGAALGHTFKTLSSQASFNNDIGVPLTLLNLEQSHQAGVLEVGTNHPGELAPLVRMIQPKFGVITSIGREHLEFFGDLAGVIEEEGWLAELLPADGRLYVNGDSPELREFGRRTRASIVRVGFHSTNQWHARELRMDTRGVRFNVETADSEYSGTYEVALLGRHQVINALLAIAVGKDFGLSRSQIQDGLARCATPKMRLQLWQIDGVDVLDDSYNANGDSMQAALETLRDFPCQGRRVAVLGDMAELGRHGLEAHAEVGRCAARTGVNHLFAVGQMAAVMGKAARNAGLSAVDEFEAVGGAGQAVRSFVRPGDVVLLKASRATGLERIGEMLKAACSS